MIYATNTHWIGRYFGRNKRASIKVISIRMWLQSVNDECELHMTYSLTPLALKFSWAVSRRVRARPKNERRYVNFRPQTDYGWSTMFTLIDVLNTYTYSKMISVGCYKMWDKNRNMYGYKHSHTLAEWFAWKGDDFFVVTFLSTCPHHTFYRLCDDCISSFFFLLPFCSSWSNY